MKQIPNLDSQIKAVIFDLGGVILRTDDPEPRRLLAERMGYTYAELDAIVFNNPVSQIAERGQATPEQVWSEIGHILKIPDSDVARFRREFFAGDIVDQSLVQLIKQIHSRFRTALLSNTWRKDLDHFIRQDLDIPNIFDLVISSAQVGIAKPDAQIFQLTLQSLAVQPGEAVFVDDNLANIEAAARLGIRAIRFLNSEQCHRDLLAHLHLPGFHPAAAPASDQ